MKKSRQKALQPRCIGIAAWLATNRATHTYNDVQQRHTPDGARGFFTSHLLNDCVV